MEFDFFNKWESIQSVKVGRQLMKKIAPLKSLERFDIEDDVFPENHPDAGENISRYVLKEARYFLAKDLSDILTGECHKLAQASSCIKDKTKSNPQVIVDLLLFILNEDITHFTLG